MEYIFRKKIASINSIHSQRDCFYFTISHISSILYITALKPHSHTVHLQDSLM